MYVLLNGAIDAVSSRKDAKYVSIKAIFPITRIWPSGFAPGGQGGFPPFQEVGTLGCPPIGCGPPTGSPVARQRSERYSNALLAII